MVSSQVVTPAIYSAWVEQDRNLIRNPRPLAYAGSGWNALGPLADGEWIVTVSPGGTAHYIFTSRNDEAIAIGDVLTYSAIIRNDDPGLAYVRFAPRSATSSYRGVAATQAVAVPAGVEVAVSFTWVSDIVAPIGDLDLSIVSASATGAFAARPAGSSFRLRRPMIVRGTTTPPFYDGDLPNTLLEQYTWSGVAKASSTVRTARAFISPEVTTAIFEAVTLTSSADEIVLYATPDSAGLGFVYDNETLSKWYELPKTNPKLNKRPNAHGAYGLGQIFTSEHRPIVSGQYFGANAAAAKAARNRLSSLFADGTPISMSVTDEAGATTRRAVWLIELVAPFANDFSHFTFDLSFVAPDPRRYGPTVPISDGMPAGGSGLVWNLGTSGSGLYFDWGTVGVLGQVSFTNTGGTATAPRIEVGGAGAFAAGFRITELETGRELTFVQATNFGDVVIFDSRTGRATVAGNDITKYLASRDWFTIPAGATRRYQINPLGAVTGAPTITLYAAPAYM